MPCSIFRSIANPIVSLSFSQARWAAVARTLVQRLRTISRVRSRLRDSRTKAQLQSPSGAGARVLPRLERLRHEERALPERDAVADVQLLQLGHDPIGAVNVETEDVLQPVVAVQPPRPCPIWTSHGQTAAGGALIVTARVEANVGLATSSSPGSAGAPPPRLPPTDAVAGQARRMRPQRGRTGSSRARPTCSRARLQ